LRISLTEIWNFISLIPSEEKGWSYQLHAGPVSIDSLSQHLLEELKSDNQYDTELLPSIFTFREILWQPDVFTDAANSLPGLNILKAFCEETVASKEEATSLDNVYNQLILGLAQNCHNAIQVMESKDNADSVAKVLGDLRKNSFPIIKFFIYHPMNRLDYYRDAVNRLNYAVKIMLTQFYGRYTELEDPYWIVNYQQPKVSVKKQAKEPKEANPEV
jgi:hypothetical protein